MKRRLPVNNPEGVMAKRKRKVVPPDPEIGKRLRTARERMGLSQRQLGALVGLDRVSIAFIELGKRQLRASECFQLADILSISPRWLVSGYDPDPYLLPEIVPPLMPAARFELVPVSSETGVPPAEVEPQVTTPVRVEPQVTTYSQEETHGQE